MIGALLPGPAMATARDLSMELVVDGAPAGRDASTASLPARAVEAMAAAVGHRSALAAMAAGEVRLTAQAGVDGRPLWTHALPTTATVMVVDGRAVDLDGDGFGEVLAAVTTLESPPDRPLALLRTHGRVLDGRTGAERWRP